MAPVFRHVEGHHHEVGDADTDLLVATGAQVRLARLERVDERDLEVVLGVLAQPSTAHNTSRITRTKAASTSA